ncbi:MAG: PIG-L deacetylase family protein [Thermoanaerobaculia bacterium]
MTAQAQPLPPGSAIAVEARRTLVLAPHFDDEVLGCGGLVRKLADRGATVRVLFLTDGSGGMEDIVDRERYAARRVEEARKAIAVLGCAGLELLGIRDGALADHRARAAEGVRQALRAFRPELVLVTSPLEVSDDHRAAFVALFDALRLPESAGPREALRSDPEIWLYEVNHPGYPDRLVDVSDCRETLEKAMGCYTSQEERHPYLRAGIGLRQFRTHTLSPEVVLAEGYRRVTVDEVRSNELATLIVALGGSAGNEVGRLEASMREMSSTRTWRIHLFLDRLRGR